VTAAAAAASLVFTAGCVGCLLYLHLFPTSGFVNANCVLPCFDGPREQAIVRLRDFVEKP
jgi:hypothetical protein